MKYPVSVRISRSAWVAPIKSSMSNYNFPVCSKKIGSRAILSFPIRLSWIVFSLHPVNAQVAMAEHTQRVAWREKSFGQRLKFGARGGKFVPLGPRASFLGHPKPSSTYSLFARAGIPALAALTGTGAAKVRTKQSSTTGPYRRSDHITI